MVMIKGLGEGYDCDVHRCGVGGRWPLRGASLVRYTSNGTDIIIIKINW